jgi:hypothetical protein
VSSKRMAPMLQKVKTGKFNFDDLEHFMEIEDGGSQARDDTDD